jgi:hypothetical protein
MKTLPKLLPLFIIAFVIGLLTNCGGESGPTPEERVAKLLKSGTWSATSTSGSIMLENIDVREDLSGFMLRFTATDYNVHFRWQEYKQSL